MCSRLVPFQNRNPEQKETEHHETKEVEEVHRLALSKMLANERNCGDDDQPSKGYENAEDSHPDKNLDDLASNVHD